MRHRHLAPLLLASLAACGDLPPPAAGAAAAPGEPPGAQAARAFFSHCAVLEPAAAIAAAQGSRLSYGEAERRQAALGGRGGHAFALPAPRGALLVLAEQPAACEVWVPGEATRALLPPVEAELGRLREGGAAARLVNRAESGEGITRSWLVQAPGRPDWLLRLAPATAESGFRSLLGADWDPGLVAAARLQAR